MITNCSHCQLDTAGNHEEGCPLKDKGFHNA